MRSKAALIGVWVRLRFQLLRQEEQKEKSQKSITLSLRKFWGTIQFRVPQKEVGKKRSAKGVRSFFAFSGLFRSLSWSLFLMLLSRFSSLFCQIPFAGLLSQRSEHSYF